MFFVKNLWGFEALGIGEMCIEPMPLSGSLKTRDLLAFLIVNRKLWHHQVGNTGLLIPLQRVSGIVQFCVLFLPKNQGPFLGLWTFTELEVAFWNIELVCWLARVLLWWLWLIITMKTSPTAWRSSTWSTLKKLWTTCWVTLRLELL